MRGMRLSRLIGGRVGCRLSLQRFACSSVEAPKDTFNYAFPITPYRSEEDWKAMRTGDPFPDDPNVDLKNFDLAVKRAHDVVQAMTEKRNTKLLHLYCGYGFVEHFGQSANFAITGCTDSQEIVDVVKDMKQYRGGAHLVNMSEPLPFNYQTFQFVVSLIPPHYTSSISIDEILRNVVHDGYALIGMSEKIWEEEKILDKIIELNDKGEIEFQSLQTTELDDCRCLYHIALVKGTN